MTRFPVLSLTQGQADSAQRPLTHACMASLFVLASLISVQASDGAPAATLVRVNCGGFAYTNAAGEVFEADRAFTGTNGWGYVGGSVAQAPRGAAVADTEDATLYLTERWGVKQYLFHVEPGLYRITFHFSEFHFNQVGQRVFDVLVNNRAVIRDLDLIERVGRHRALVLSRVVPAEDGRIVVAARETADRVKFCAIEIEPAEPDGAPPSPPRGLRAYPRDGEIGLEWQAVEADDLRGHRVYRATGATGGYVRVAEVPADETWYVDTGLSNAVGYCYKVAAVDHFDNESDPSEWVEVVPRARAPEDLTFGLNLGGADCRDEKGRRFLADRAYTPANAAGFRRVGRVLAAPQKDVPEPMRSVREGSLVYRFDLPAGLYRITLGFFDPWSREEKDRVFSVYLNDLRILHDLDLRAQYGSRFAAEIGHVYRVRGGEGLEVSLRPRYGQPLLSFIHVEPCGPDQEPPAAPRIRTVAARDGIVYLVWTPSTETDLAGYHVLRAADRPTAFRMLTREPVGVPFFLDETARNGAVYFYEVLAVDASGHESGTSDAVRALPHFPDDEELLEIVSRAAFQYFVEQCDPRTFLVNDKNVSEVKSVAATGFGLSALCVGAERGWIAKDEAERRAYLALRALNYFPDNKVNGLFFHYLDGSGARSTRGYEDVVSTVDSALLMWGALAAGEYFGGRVKAEAELMLSQMNWRAYADEKRKLVMMAYRPEAQKFEGAWDFYTDEALLITLLGIGAPNPDFRLGPEYFYSFKRERKNYKDIQGVVYSWSGSLFTYAFAHCWLDFRRIGPDRPEQVGFPPELRVNWWENSVKAVQAHKAFSEFIATRHKAFGPNAWGLSACSGPGGRYLACGAPPCGGAVETGGGTLALYAAGMAVPFLPEDALGALRHYYGYRDEQGRKRLWRDEFAGGYGLIDAFNVEEDFYSDEVHGINHGPMLLLIENYRSGLLWKLTLKNPAVREALRRVGFVLPSS